MEKKMTDDQEFLEAELAQLADGSLPASREAELREELRRSPDLARALAEQEQAISLIRASDVQAPDSLRTWLHEQTRESRERRRPSWLRPRIAFPAAAGAAVAAAALALVLVLSGGGSSAPNLTQATSAAVAPATMPAPTEASETTLDISTAGIPFPYWHETVGWDTVGARVDSLAGRHAVTVFYRSPYGERVGYTIVSGPPLPVNGGTTVTSHGIPFTFKRFGSARMVTWLRNGHTCVIAGHGISNLRLLHLATADIPD
jgi:hypothetical protein